MTYLILVSLVWAFSFGLIGNHLTDLPSSFTAFARLFLSLIIFLPFCRPIAIKRAIRLMGLGAVQFGVMYVTYISAFSYLPSHEVALFTVTTPVYVVLLDDLYRKRFHFRHLGTALLVIAGCGLILWKGGEGIGEGSAKGFMILQISNLSFALGQWIYARLNLAGESKGDTSGLSLFAYLYLGACLILLPGAVPDLMPTLKNLSSSQILILLYLGIVASGVCFFLWNTGARKVSSVQLAVMNNLKIPLAALCSLLFFGESNNAWTLIPGLVLVLAGFLLTGKNKKS